MARVLNVAAPDAESPLLVVEFHSRTIHRKKAEAWSLIPDRGTPSEGSVI